MPSLSEANGQANGGSANSFDAQGDRLSRVSDVGKASQKTTSYLVDTDTSYAQVIEERAPDTSDAAGQPVLQARYVWGEGLAPLAMWRKMLDGSVKLFFHIADGQESVRQLTSASGEVTDSYFYDAWGNALAGGSGTTVNPFRYTGQQLDPDGRYYLRARFYNPGNGRFLSHDPLMGDNSEPVSLHRYLYAGVDGVNFCDPSGKLALEMMVVTMMQDMFESVSDALADLRAMDSAKNKFYNVMNGAAIAYALMFPETDSASFFKWNFKFPDGSQFKDFSVSVDGLNIGGKKYGEMPSSSIAISVKYKTEEREDGTSENAGFTAKIGTSGFSVSGSYEWEVYKRTEDVYETSVAIGVSAEENFADSKTSLGFTRALRSNQGSPGVPSTWDSPTKLSCSP